MKRMRRRRPRRDKDYRGTRSPVDWSHLVHQVRTKKPGALEVLQDAINVWFPQQFAAAKREANRRAFQQSIYYGEGIRHYVGFDARRARERFLPRERRTSHASKSPFIVRSSTMVPKFTNVGTAYIYSTTGRRSTREGELPKSRERKALRPFYTGSYKRPKVPLIHWERRNEDEDSGEAEILLVVRGPGAGTWAENKGDILGEQWDVESPTFAHVSFDEYPGWRRELRKEGYRNKMQFYEYGIPR